ncbi:hypothetical protein KY338_02340 [Candidatus Woesearchaeota archaeon]|nr:hypothetical protein [Candidatus Woesearchaeota archaeon]MBW3006129.1 hypothetical protein [Candidatus Woesearchaeota archaeon]
MTIKTSDDLRKVVVEAIAASGKRASHVVSSGQPQKNGDKIICYENTCLCRAGVYKIIVQHFYKHFNLDDFVSFSSSPAVDQEDREISVIEDMLRNAGVKVSRRSRINISFEVPPEEEALRNAIIVYFKAEQEVWQASCDYHKKLDALRKSKPDIS